MAARLELLKEQFFDDDGDVLSGGYLYTYIVGTSTPKATYTTVTGDVEQANPVVLDSAGRIPSDLYGTGSYKIVIKDSSGNIIDTIPTASGINSGSMTTIGDYSGDFDAAITAIGATATTLYINSTATMSTAVTVPATCTIVLQKGGVIDQGGYALTLNGPLIVHGGTITNDAALTVNAHFTDTIFQVFTSTGTVTFGSSSIGFRRPEWFYSGSGLYTTAFERCIVSNSVTELVGGKTYSMSPDGITNAANITGKDNWTLNGNGAILKFDDSVTNGAILFIDNCDDVRINNVEFDGNISGGSVGNRQALTIRKTSPADISTGACNRVMVENCYFHDTISGAVSYDADGILAIGVNDLIIRGNIVNNTDVGFLIRQSDQVVIADNIIKSGGTADSISLWGDSDAIANTDVSITGNVVQKQIVISFVDGCSVTGNTMTYLAIGGGSTSDIAQIANDVVVSGNILTKRINVGFQNGTLTDSTANNVLISDNVWNLADSYAIWEDYKSTEINIKDNIIKLAQNITIGINFDGTSSDITISGNKINNNSKTIENFIKVATTTTSLYISENNFPGETSGYGLNILTAVDDVDTVHIWDNHIPLERIFVNTGAPGTLRNNRTSLAAMVDIASAATITLYNNQAQDDRLFNITGTTNITSVTATRPNHMVTLKFAGILDFTDGSNLKLAGTMTTSADDTITIICDGTNWYEVSRSAN